MAQPFLGEVRIFSFPYAPKGWAFTNGQLMAIAQNQALFSLLGTTFGGDGITTFALPKLQNSVVIGFNGPHPMGQVGGEATHTLLTQEIPAHNHVPYANDAAGTQLSPVSGYWAKDSNNNTTFGTVQNVLLSPLAIGNAGTSQPHSNLMPCSTLNFCIALVGIFPSRS